VLVGRFEGEGSGHADKLLVEEDCFIFLDDDAVFEVAAEAACEHDVFDIFSEPHHIFEGVVVTDADDVLFDDWSGIEFFGCIVACGADEFDSAFDGLLVGSGSDERGQEAVVDIDDAMEVFIAEPAGKYLHVAGKDNGVRSGLLDQSSRFAKGGFFACGVCGNGHMVKWNLVPFDQLAQGFMVGNHTGNIAPEVPDFPPVQEVGKAVVNFADEYDNFLASGRVGQPPVHAKPFRHRAKARPECFEFRDATRQCKHIAHEEHVATGILVLAGLDDGGTGCGDMARDGSHDTYLIGAATHEAEGCGIIPLC
jgi:hypothetical protein